MRAGAQRQGKPRHDRTAAWPGWLVAASVCLVFAVAYLLFSIAEASRDPSSRVAVREIPSELGSREETAGEPEREEARQSEDVPPASVGQPLPGLAPATFDPTLVREIEAAAGDDASHIAVSVRRISDGRSASLNGDFQFYAASTFKLAVLYEAELRRFRGELAYDDTLVISEEDAAEDLGTSGYLEFEEDGSITVASLLSAMIRVSDNSSAVALMHAFGAANIDRTLRGLGVETMTLNQVELWTTANDLARLMEVIYAGEGVGAEERDHMRDLLLGQTIRNGIPAALADEVTGGLRIGNKTGTWPGAQHDVAFIEAQTGAYVLAVLTDGSYEGWLALQRVTTRIHNAMTISP